MAFLAVNVDGTEVAFSIAPTRKKGSWSSDFGGVILPTNSIEKIIGRKLTWNDDPIDTSKGSMEKLEDWWIARDKDGVLNAFENCPAKRFAHWEAYDGEKITLPSHLFPMITWEDSTPRKIETTFTVI